MKTTWSLKKIKKLKNPGFGAQFLGLSPLGQVTLLFPAQFFNCDSTRSMFSSQNYNVNQSALWMSYRWPQHERAQENWPLWLRKKGTVGEGERVKAWGDKTLAHQAIKQWLRMESLDAVWDSSHPSQLVFRTCVQSWREDKTPLPHGSEGIVNCLNMTPLISPRFRSSGSENLLLLPLPPYAISSPHFPCTGENLFAIASLCQPASSTETSPREIVTCPEK